MYVGMYLISFDVKHLSQSLVKFFDIWKVGNFSGNASIMG